MHINYRKIVYTALYDIIYNKQFCHLYITNLLKDKSIDVKSIRVIRKEVYGIIENKILIDYIINKYAEIKKIDKKILLVLYIGVYELLFLDNKKEYAIVNECVELAKSLKGQFLSNFVNAILKNILKKENLDELYKDDSIDDKIKYSIPDELYDYLVVNINKTNEKEDSKDTIKNIFKYFLVSNNICFRVNNKKSAIIDRINAELNELNIDYNIYNGDLKLNNFIVYLVTNLINLNHIDCFEKGYLSVADVASLYYIDKLYETIKNYIDIKALLKNEKLYILDACASPGGKTLSLFNLLKYYIDEHNLNSDFIQFISQDISEDKIMKIKSNIDREIADSYRNNISCLIKDATTTFNDYIDKFDLVMLDVPCSGLGSIAKKPDIKYNFSSLKIDELNMLQYKILDVNKEYVKKDGILSYSTCTFVKQENDDMINIFLEKNDNFKLLHKEQILPNINNKSDGFFYSIMKKVR